MFLSGLRIPFFQGGGFEETTGFWPEPFTKSDPSKEPPRNTIKQAKLTRIDQLNTGRRSDGP